jgi:hypothetical protein
MVNAYYYNTANMRCSENQQPKNFAFTQVATTTSPYRFGAEIPACPANHQSQQQPMRVNRKRSSSNESEDDGPKWTSASLLPAPVVNDNHNCAPSKRRRGLTDATTATVNHAFPVTGAWAGYP